MSAETTPLALFALIGLVIYICPQVSLASPTQFTDLKVLEELLSKPEILATQGARVRPPFYPGDQADIDPYIAYHYSRHLLNAIYSWAFFTEDSIPNPFGDERKEKTSLQCARRYILESVNGLLLNMPLNRRDLAIQNVVKEIRYNSTVFVKPGRISGVYAADDLVTADQKLDDLFQKAHSAVASKLQPFTSTTADELRAAFASARVCDQSFDVASALPWFDHPVLIELATGKRKQKEIQTQLAQVFKTTKLPELPAESPEFKVFTFAPTLGLSIKENSRISDNFLAAYWKMIPEKAYESDYVTAKTCAAIYPYLVWGNLFGLQVTGESAHSLKVTADVFKDWMTLRTTVGFASAHNSGCEAALHFIEALWPESDHEVTASTYEELWQYRMKSGHFFEFESYQMLGDGFIPMAQIDLRSTENLSAKWAKATVSYWFGAKSW